MRGIEPNKGLKPFSKIALFFCMHFFFLCLIYYIVGYRKWVQSRVGSKQWELNFVVVYIHISESFFFFLKYY